MCYASELPEGLSEMQFLGITSRVSDSTVLGEAWEFAFWNSCQVMLLMSVSGAHCQNYPPSRKMELDSKVLCINLLPPLFEIKLYPFILASVCLCVCVRVWTGEWYVCEQKSEKNLASDLFWGGSLFHCYIHQANQPGKAWAFSSFYFPCCYRNTGITGVHYHWHSLGSGDLNSITYAFIESILPHWATFPRPQAPSLHIHRLGQRWFFFLAKSE